MMEINSHFIRFTGKANIPEPLELGHGYKVHIDGSIEKISDHNNNDGTYDRSYTFVPVLCEIEDDLGNIVKAKDTRSHSSQVRRMLYLGWLEDTDNKKGVALSADEEYDIVMKYIKARIYKLREQALLEHQKKQDR